MLQLGACSDEPAPLTVTFNSSGGSTVQTQKVKKGGKATKPADPSKDKVLFDAWFTDEALTKAFDFNTAVTANTTLYAKWKTTIVGTITGLTAGATVELLLQIDGNNAETITLQNAQTTFAFSKEIKNGQTYFVSVQTQPTTADGLKCWVENGSGTMGSENISLTAFCSNSTKYELVAKSDGSYYSRTECVKDNETGLIWEGKTDDGGLRDKDNKYSNYDDATQAQKGSSNPTQAEIDASTNSIGYVSAVNASNFAGFNDWRRPTDNELLTLVNKSYNITRIDPTWFPNIGQFLYWTSTPSNTYADMAKAIVFGNLTSDFVTNARRLNISIRLVRTAN